jgi:hypothetical protein
MTIDKEFTSRFVGAESIEARTGLQGLPEPSGIAMVQDIESVEWGAKAMEVWEEINNNESVDVYGLIQLIKEDIKEQSSKWKADNEGDPFPLLHMTICDKAVINLRPTAIRNSNDKDNFAEAMKTVSEKICSDLEMKPYMSVLCGEAWSCCLRNSFIKKIACIPQEARSRIIESMLNDTMKQFGGISNIPEDHPAVVKYDIMMLSFQFKSNNGSAHIMYTMPINDDEEVTSDETGILNDSKETEDRGGRFHICTNRYKKIGNYDSSKFKTKD